MEIYEECIICGNEIRRKKGSGRRARTVRSKRSLTCNPEHSKIYNRIAKKVGQKYMDRIVKLKKRLAEYENVKTNY